MNKTNKASPVENIFSSRGKKVRGAMSFPAFKTRESFSFFSFQFGRSATLRQGSELKYSVPLVVRNPTVGEQAPHGIYSPTVGAERKTAAFFKLNIGFQ